MDLQLIDLEVLHIIIFWRDQLAHMDLVVSLLFLVLGTDNQSVLFRFQ